MCSCSSSVSAQSVHSWITSEMYGLWDDARIVIKDSPVSAEQLASLLNSLSAGSLTGALGKKVSCVTEKYCVLCNRTFLHPLR